MYLKCVDLTFSRYFKIFIHLFIFGWAESLSLHARFLQLQRASAVLPCGAWASHCIGRSCCRALALGGGLSSCDAWAQLLHGPWNLPGPGSNMCPLYQQMDTYLPRDILVFFFNFTFLIFQKTVYLHLNKDKSEVCTI